MSNHYGSLNRNHDETKGTSGSALPNNGGRNSKIPLGGVKNSAKNHPKINISSDIEMIDVSLNKSGTDGIIRAKADKTNENEVKGPTNVEETEKKKDGAEAELREVEDQS